MNKVRRKEIEKVIALLDEARTRLEEINEEEQEAFDNMPEGIQMSERGEKMENCIYYMEDVIGALEDASENLQNEVIDA